MWWKITLLVLADVAASLGYTWLASGGPWHFGVTFFLLPVAAVFLLIMCSLGGELACSGDYPPYLEPPLLQGEKESRFGPAFWGFAIYFLLPVILRGAAVGLDKWGYPAAADLFFALRYWSLLIVFGVMVVWVFLRAAFPPSRQREHGFAQAT